MRVNKSDPLQKPTLKEKEKKNKDKDKLMAERQAHAQERRIHELDQNVERFFEVRKRLGKGAYGIVWKATDKRQKETVALKKIYDAFRDETDAQRTYREVVFLRAFRHHPNIIRMLDIFKASNNLDFYLVFEFMDSDLHNVIKKGDVLKDIHKRFVMYQLINAIKYMHSGNVIHRDLKPSNILIDSKCRLKVADFGLARTLCPKKRHNNDLDCTDAMDNEAMLTDYVATRWYRAPEILVASRKYTKGIDMWSLGCILGEMIRQKPLFQGTSTINQIEKIVSALPDVTERDIESIGASFGSVLLSKKVVRDRSHLLDEMLANSCDDAMSLVKSLLVLDPDGRLTAKEAITHSYVHRFRAASANMEMRMDIKPPLDDDVRYGVNEYRSTLYDMIAPEMRFSARYNNDSHMSPPAGNVDLPSSIGTRHVRSVSKSRPFSTNGPMEFGAQPMSNLTKAWAEDHRKHRQMQQHPQRQQQQQQQHPQLQPQLQPQPSSSQQFQQEQPRQHHQHHNHHHRSKRLTNEPNPMRCTPSSVAAEQSQVPLSRELAAVAATAPRCAGGGLWQAPVTTSVGPSAPPPQSRSWMDSMPAHGLPPMHMTTPGLDLELLPTTSQLQGRERRLRKEAKERRPDKPRVETKPAKESRLKYHLEHLKDINMDELIEQRMSQMSDSLMSAHLRSRLNRARREQLAQHENEETVKIQYAYDQAEAQVHAEAQAQAYARAQAQSRPLAEAHRHVQAKTRTQTQQQQQPQHQNMGNEYSKRLDMPMPTWENQQLDHQELQQKKSSGSSSQSDASIHSVQRCMTGKLNTPESTLRLMDQQQQQQQQKQQQQQQQQKQKLQQQRHGGDEVGRNCIPKDMVQQVVPPMEAPKSEGDNRKVEGFVCYKSRLSRLEDEMTKCKRQLFHYVQDNQQVLNKQNLRQHIERLLQTSPPSSILKTRSPQSDFGVEADQSRLTAGSSKQERDKQKQLQMREFLARDENNANAYELPDLCNVYKSSSYHAQPLLQTQLQLRAKTKARQSTPSATSSSTSILSDSDDMEAFVRREFERIIAERQNDVSQLPESAQEPGLGDGSKVNVVPPAHQVQRQQQLSPPSSSNCDRLRIQEANFYTHHDKAYLGSQHAVPK